MSSTVAWLSLSALVSILFTASTTGQSLEAEFLDVKLPFPNSCPTAHYDGQDSIYLFGGCYPSSNTDIWKFSTLSETLQHVGSLPGRAEFGTLQSDNSGNIFYFGGGGGSTEVFKFDPTSNRTTTVATLPSNLHAHISTKYNATSNSVFILGGSSQGKELLTLDMATLTTSILSTNLPFDVYGGSSVPVGGNKAYIFDDSSPDGNRMALELDLDTYELQPVGPPTLPNFYYYPSSVYDGNKAYVIGGYEPTTESPSDGLIQFDPITKEHNFIPVGNFPVEGSGYFYIAPASIFVPSRNRIYLFGGQSYAQHNIISHDEIFYIDMSPMARSGPTSRTALEPDLFTCNGQPNGVYPNPRDCSLFIGCHDEEITFFSCPSPLIFDKVGLRCDYPDAVTCS